ncbi:hypothetical protein RND71_035266 [Anisodus tanguticus]|uniref:DUF7745 domain-containing protein n=1 Tax=Anisodus tanguticus TaxID=243964 RepID=A0AAE1R4K8_9SOLA|nr:hypothetical protein RND71_035266 [Anisodus tanguticus]
MGWSMFLDLIFRVWACLLFSLLQKKNEARDFNSVDSFDWASVGMVNGILSKLKMWWADFDLGSQMEIRRRLGCLVSFFDISPDQHLVKALIRFWDPDRVVFKFRDFEITPTLEEINYFTNLIYQGRGQISPHGQSGKKFLRHLGLKNTKELWCFKNN